MAKHDLLTEEEFKNYQPPSRAVKQLTQFIQSKGLAANQVKVLDWGCGRGRFVLWLREQGFDAYGVDIDQEPINNGLPLFEQKGHKQKPLSLISPEGRTNYPDGFFDFIMTDNVLEHVSDLNLVMQEVNRLTSPTGGGYHIFPAQRQPREGHLFMPFVHWLPKGAFRKSIIRLSVRFRKEPHWKEVEGLSVNEKTQVYYDYSTDHIFYRPFQRIKAIFENQGFTITFLTLQNPSIQQHRWLGVLSRNGIFKPLINWLVLTFKQVELSAARSKGSSDKKA